ncbi:MULTISPECIES: DUF6165 family protein [unclassified Roseibium]|uniref:DUF6165 family protein n=1 Tax=unclassified Roseibium TaxID=2629323 RepID=UPI0027401436|nr:MULTISPECIES: DUF6165 family protein [unclassified Roseibium]
MKYSAPISAGELLDKITILELKLKYAEPGSSKFANVKKELDLLMEVAGDLLNPDNEAFSYIDDLRSINQKLWIIEDEIRVCESNEQFGPEFVALARSVYITNDERASCKRKINIAVKSELIEEKLY